MRQRAARSRRLVAEWLAEWKADADRSAKAGEGETSMAKKTSSAGALHKLTARQVQAAGDGDHSDGGGLLLRIRTARALPSGKQQAAAEAWVYRYTAPSGKRREMGLGPAYRGSTSQAGETLTTARALAHKAREVLAHGTDPLTAREQQRDTERDAADTRKAERARAHWTLAHSAREYHERVIEKTRTTRHAAQWISSLENHMPAALWKAPIASITAPALLAALESIKPHERARNLTSGDTVPETVSRIRQRLDAVFEDAIFHGRATMNPAAAVRRKMREGMPKKKAGHFAALAFREAPAFFQRLQQAEGTAARTLLFAMLTAARTSEALGAAWSEFDVEAGTQLIAAERMKSSGKDKPEPHLVHLSAEALAIVNAQRGQDERLVFPSTMPSRNGKEQSNMAMLAVLDRLGMRDKTTVHGLCRATFSTWAYETAAARPDVIEACLAHREADKVKAAYSRAQFTEERKALLAAWAAYLTRPAAAVVPINSRAA